MAKEEDLNIGTYIQLGMLAPSFIRGAKGRIQTVSEEKGHKVYQIDFDEEIGFADWKFDALDLRVCPQDTH